jgi:hypothetical protein
MVKASQKVTGGLAIPVKEAARVSWPQCLGDVRKHDAKGQPMWIEIKDLIRSGALQQTERAREAYG